MPPSPHYSRRQQIKARAVVLKRRPYSEHDWLFTVFSHDLGKLTVLARGARRIYSKRLASLSVFNLVDLILYQSRPTGFHSLSEVNLVTDYIDLKNRLTTVSNAWHGLELIDRLYPDNQPGPAVFDLTTFWLSLINQSANQLSDTQVNLATKAFLIKLIKLAGFWSNHLFKSSTKLTDSLSWLEKSKLNNLAAYKLTPSQIKYLDIIDHYLENSEHELFNRPTQARQLFTVL